MSAEVSRVNSTMIYRYDPSVDETRMQEKRRINYDDGIRLKRQVEIDYRNRVEIDQEGRMLYTEIRRKNIVLIKAPGLAVGQLLDVIA